MKYGTEMGSGAMLQVPNFIQIGSGLRNLMGGIHRQTQDGDLISLLLFFKIRKAG
jgi:hypothetical protein